MRRGTRAMQFHLVTLLASINSDKKLSRVASEVAVLRHYARWKPSRIG